MNFNRSLIAPNRSTLQNLSAVLTKPEIDLPSVHCPIDHSDLQRDLCRLEDDLADGDLTQSQERLFSLFSALLLDPSMVCRSDDDAGFRATVAEARRQRERFQEPVCALYAQYREQWIRRLRSEFQARHRKSHQRWTSGVEGLVEQHRSYLSDALYTTDQDLRFLAVRWLIQHIDVAVALRHLRQARDEIERYETYLERKQHQCGQLIEKEREEQLRQELEHAERGERSIRQQLSRTTEQLSAEKRRLRRSEEQVSQRDRQVQRLHRERDCFERRSTRDRAELRQLQQHQQELAAKLAEFNARPSWQDQVETEEAVNRRYAERIDRIEQDRSLSEAMRNELIRKTHEEWDIAHHELMQPAQQGAERCETFEDSREHSPEDPFR